ncbi:MAG: Tol-Pal system beta propeller repeat protein TolB [Gammaproteobacteria bacterium]
MTRTILALLALLGAAGLPAPAQAVLEIRITETALKALPIAIVPFGAPVETALPTDVAGVIAADLQRSGRFAPMPFGDLPSRPSELSQVNFKDWRLLGMENLVIGRVVPVGPDQYEVEFRLVDVFRGTTLAGYRIPTGTAALRFTAHQIADIIYEKLLGQRGAFATRVAYVTVEGKGDPKRGGRGRTYKLQLSDADGYDARTLVTSAEPLLSPAWSPDGRRIAYVSFENRNSAIWIQDVETGRREQVSGGIGINSAPSWSPDGRSLALTLSRDGNPEIYILDLASRAMRRITNDPGIDTEADFAPDGRSLAFTSDRGGGPQIYTVSLSDGSVRRLTFDMGRYNSRPRWSPDGKRLAFVHGEGGAFRIATMEIGGGMELLTQTRMDESPSFAPNGSMIIYTTTTGRGTELAAVSVDGRVRQRLSQSSGEVREPDWGPLPR